MDDILLDCDEVRLKISVSGIDGKSGTVALDDFRLNLYAFETAPKVKAIFLGELAFAEAARLHGYLDAISLLRESSVKSGRFVELQSSPSVV